MKLRVLTRGGLLMFALAFVVAGLAFPLAASAVTEPAVWKSGGIDYAKGTIALGARFETPTAEVQLWSGTTLLSTAVAVSPNTTVRLAPYRLKSKVTLKVRALKQDRTVLWERLVTLDPASYKPHKPKLTNTVFSMVVPTSTWTYRGTAGHPVTKIKAYNRQAEKTTYYPQTLEATGKFHFTVKLPWGDRTREITAYNGFGKSPIKVRRVFYLGSGHPDKTRYVYICKKTLWMHHVYKKSVIKRWPVAIGTPQTPTPTGLFRIGRKQSTSGVWGPLRRPLLRYRSGEYYRSGYYVHGTNAPWSIGMMASHGCVRMYNSQVRVFADTVPNYTWVKIR